MTEIQTCEETDNFTLTPEELDLQLDNFESIIEMLEKPIAHAVSEEDLELINEIYMRLNCLPNMDSFEMEGKQKVKQESWKLKT